MLFNSYAFIFGFAPVVLAGFFLAGRTGHQRAALIWLLCSSFFFYAWWDVTALPLLAASITFNYILSRAIEKAATHRRRLALLACAVTANLACLAYFKYAGFIATNLNASIGTTLPVRSAVLPLAISFFTFQQIACVVDRYRGVPFKGHFLTYAVFVSFFPHLIAGPIVRDSELLPQFESRRILRPQPALIATGLSIFFIGLFKKVIIGDTLAQFVAVPFSAAAVAQKLTIVEAWAAALSYTFQIYFDFSGYSDMAIGLGLLFGVWMPVNFNSPYKASSIIEFWRRWHITLSRFLRDYLYIPLGGSRTSTFRRYSNLLITMILGGLWHGAAWTFVAWGALHGTYLLLNHGWRAMRTGRAHAGHPLSVLTARALTFVAVVIAWVLFRADSLAAAGRMIRAMAGLDGVSLPRAWEPVLAPLARLMPVDVLFGGMGTLGGTTQLFWLAAAAAIVWLLPNTQQLMLPWLMRHSPGVALIAPEVPPSRLQWRPSIGWAAATAVLAAIAIAGLTRASVFIYFQF